jgi:hypothetical protein
MMIRILSIATVLLCSYCSANILSGSKVHVFSTEFATVLYLRIPSSTQVSASIKDTVVNGIEGLNINLEAPFRVQDYVVGFKYALGNLNKIPEAVFARKSFDTAGDGKLSVSADYSIPDNSAQVSASWFSNPLGLTVGVCGNTNEKVTLVEAQKDHVVGPARLSVKAAYDVCKKVFAGSVDCDIENTNVQLTCSSDDVDPVLSVTRAIDAQNSITPSIAVKSGRLAYAWKRNWMGGSLLTRLHPSGANKRVEVEWRDEGSSGSWVTNAEFPLDSPSSKARISITRDWKQ